MKYEELLKMDRPCPYCSRTDDEIITENETCFLTYSKAPYIQDHMLVIPKRHIESYFEMTDAERADIVSLQTIGATILKNLGCDAFSLLLREGAETGKSVAHVHAHIVPRMPLEGNYGGAERNVLSENEIKAVVDRLRQAL